MPLRAARPSSSSNPRNGTDRERPARRERRDQTADQRDRQGEEDDGAEAPGPEAGLQQQEHRQQREARQSEQPPVVGLLST